MSALLDAYELAATVYERNRQRGDSPAMAMSRAVAVLRNNARATQDIVPREAVDTAGLVASSHGLTLEKIRTARGNRYVSRAVEAIVDRLRADGHTFAVIGRVLRRDHSTCVDALQRRQRRQGPAAEARAA